MIANVEGDPKISAPRPRTGERREHTRTAPAWPSVRDRVVAQARLSSAMDSLREAVLRLRRIKMPRPPTR